MTTQEQQMLQGLTDRVNQTVLEEKDSSAEQLLQQALGRNPDALYILSQTVLVQQYALDQAQKQLADARQQLDQQRQQPPPPPKHEGSFLGNLLHLNDEPSRPAPPPPPPAYTPVQQYAPAQQQYAQPSYAQPAGQPAYGAPQQGGFLRSALQTATGVAAGALAFQGIESLMHGFGGGGGGFGGGSGFGGFSGQPREEIVNNYYGDSAGSEHGDLASRLSPDVDDRRDDSSRFADTNSDNQADNSTDNFADDSDDSGSDDFDSDDSNDTSGSDDGSF